MHTAKFPMIKFQTNHIYVNEGLVQDFNIYDHLFFWMPWKLNRYKPFLFLLDGRIMKYTLKLF